MSLCHDASADAMRSSCADGATHAVDGPVLRVLTLNASHGRSTALNQLLVSGTQTKANLDAIASLLSLVAADAVALQEADAPSRWSGGFNHVDYIADRSEYRCIVHGLHSLDWISTYGTAIMARAQIFEPESIRFQPSWPSRRKGYVVGQLTWVTDRGSHRITIASVHFDFLSKKARDSQVSELIAGLAEIGGPLILLGDLNSEWNEKDSHVQRLSRELDLHAYEPNSPELGTYKKPTGKRLDWVLISADLEFREHVVLTAAVSDHLAVYADIAFRETDE